MKLLLSALTKFTLGLLLVGLLLFLPAGTLQYAGGWLFIGLLFVPMFLFGSVLFLRAPNLLQKRLNAKEKEPAQRSVVALSGLFFTCGFVIAGLDHRFSWSHVPMSVVIAAAIVFLSAYGLYAEVMRENAYLSRTVKVEKDQPVIDTGLYSIVRHPMYMATILLFLSIPLLLGSWYALLCFLPYPVLIIIRIRNEEKVLTENLAGYEKYKKKVRYRLLPFLW